MLYKAPRARVRTNEWLSQTFSLHRGTRQGCPLSLSLFALALEPLAFLIRESSEVRGLQVGRMEQNLFLYADDSLLFLNDAGLSLSAALNIVGTFDSFLGIRINWYKSTLFPIDDQGINLVSPIPLK